MNLLEQFLNGVDLRVHMYLCKRRVESLEEVVRLAEDYELVTRLSYGAQHTRNEVRGEMHMKTSGSQGLSKPRCYICGHSDNLAAVYPKRLTG